jgi:hypothetical protein
LWTRMPTALDHVEQRCVGIVKVRHS